MESPAFYDSPSRTIFAVSVVALALAPSAARAHVNRDDAEHEPSVLATWAGTARSWTALANHGPGTSGGGSSTPSGETLKAGAFELGFREDYTQFKHFDQFGAEAQALASGDEFDALHRAFVTTVSFGYGITDDIQVGVLGGYYRGDDFISAAPDGSGGVESGTANPAGFMDTWISGKFRVMQGAPGNLSIIAGVKLPTGRDDVLLSNGEKLEASSQPGTGAIDFQAGLGYSRFLTSTLTIDAGGIYTFRTEHDDFKVGDRVDLGVALAYRITDNITEFPQWSVFAELTAVMLQKDTSAGVQNLSSGGTTLYLTPGARVRFNEHVALTVAPSVPVLQDLNGDQDKTRFKVSAVLSFSF